MPRPAPQRGVLLRPLAPGPADPGRAPVRSGDLERRLRGQRGGGGRLRLRPGLLRVPRGVPGPGQRRGGLSAGGGAPPPPPPRPPPLSLPSPPGTPLCLPPPPPPP